MTELARQRERDVVVVLHRPPPVELAYLPGNASRRMAVLVAVQFAAVGAGSLLEPVLPPMVKPLVVGLLVALPLVAYARIPPWLRRRRMQAVPAWDGRAEPSASLVRWMGVVRAEGEPFTAPFGAGVAVYTRTHYFPVTRQLTIVEDGREEIRGVPFRVESASGQTVLVTPSQVWLLDPDRKVHKLTEAECAREGVQTAGKGRKYQQTILRVGDHVEVVGRLDREVSPTGSAAPGRGVPTELVVRPAWKGGVWIRRLPGFRTGEPPDSIEDSPGRAV